MAKPSRTFSEGAKPIPPSTQYSNCLYHFDKKPDRIIAALQRKGFTLNYVVEDFSFLHIDHLSTIAFPMLCFCDIPNSNSRLLPHMRKYGLYGIGLTKEWGRANSIQPVHYLAESSPFVADLCTALQSAFSLVRTKQDDNVENLLDFLISVLAYAKPVWGLNDNEPYCFEDECEWRIIPDEPLKDNNMPTFLPRPGKEELDNFRQTLRNPNTYLLKFDYTDVERLFIPKEEASCFIDVINGLKIGDTERDLLKTKIREDEPRAGVFS